jgi:hypothetical protein
MNLAETSPNGGSYAGLIRARRGTSPQRVAAAVDAVGRIVDTRDFKSRGLKLYPVGLKPDLVSSVRPALLVLGFAGVFLVLVLMVNFGSVLLARAARREHEYAVSRALGANGAAVARATLSEGAILGLIGGVAATVAATWGTRTLIALAPLDLPRRESVAVDVRIGVVVVGLGILLGLVAAILPALWVSRVTLSSLLASSAVRGGGGHGRMRHGMVVAQVALSLVLLSTGGLVVRSFERLLRADPGFRPEGLLTMRVPIPSQIVPKEADAMVLQDRIERAFAAIPGVAAVSATSALPLTASADQTGLSIPGAPGNTGNAERDRPLVDYIGVRAGYLDVLGMRVIAGRGFEPARHAGVREAVIDRLLARQFFPTGNPLGARIPFDDQSLSIVGVVGSGQDVRRSPGRSAASLHPRRGLGLSQSDVRSPHPARTAQRRTGCPPLHSRHRSPARARRSAVDGRRDWRCASPAATERGVDCRASRSARWCSPRWDCSESSPVL